MRAMVIYESMFGNTRRIADAIAEGIGSGPDVEVFGVAVAQLQSLAEIDLLIVGGPTHVRGMSRPSTRQGASNYVRKPGSNLVLEPGADMGPGVREWLALIGTTKARSVAFDTRIKAPAALTGRASKAIARELARHGTSALAAPESFFVDKKSHVLPGELDRARAWGTTLAMMIDQPGKRHNLRAEEMRVAVELLTG